MIALSAGTAGALAVTGTLGPAETGGPSAPGGPAAFVARPAPPPTAPVAASLPAPGSMPSVTAAATCSQLTVSGDGLRQLSVTVTYTVSGGTYRLYAAEGTLHDGDSWTTSFSYQVSTRDASVDVGNLLGVAAHQPHGDHLGTIRGPGTSASC